MADARAPDDGNSPAGPHAMQNEPPLIERARRGGWLALAVSLLFALGWRFGGQAGWMIAFAVGFGIAGVLAVVNVALVRSLYRQLELPKDQPPPDQSM